MALVGFNLSKTFEILFATLYPPLPSMSRCVLVEKRWSLLVVVPPNGMFYR